MAHLQVSASQIFGRGRQLVVVDHSHVSNPRGILPFLRGVPPAKAAEIHRLLCDAVDDLGRASAQAQGLPAVITSASKLAMSPDQLLYLLIDSESDRIVGMIKTGKKRLFLSDHRQDSMVECQPLCILDFYVVESQQRRGHGRQLCDAVLATEGVQIEHFAIDRPSAKMLAFLSRHYGLTKPHSQRNNFTVFESFFSQSNPVLSRISSGFRRNLRKSFSTEVVSNGHLPRSASGLVEAHYAKQQFADNNHVQHRHPSQHQQHHHHHQQQQHWRLDHSTQYGGRHSHPRTLPPVHSAAAPMGQSEYRFAQDQQPSSDVYSSGIKKVSPIPSSSKQQDSVFSKPPLAMPLLQSPKPAELLDPPVLSRGPVPDTYRQLFGSANRSAKATNYGLYETINSRPPVKSYLESKVDQIQQNSALSRALDGKQSAISRYQQRPHIARPF